MTARSVPPLLLGLALVGCGRPEPVDSERPVDSAPAAEASCELDEENALRIRCSVMLDAPAAPTLVLSAPGVPTRTFEAAEQAQNHTMLAWGLKAETEYTWSVGGFTGTVTTGPLPPGFSLVQMDTTGTMTGYDALLIPLRCVEGYFAMVDGDGDIIWYLYEPLYTNAAQAYDWSDEDQTLLVGRGANLVERSLSGDTVFQLEHPAYDGRLHHDVERADGLTYLLTDETIGLQQVDAVHVFDGDTALGSFRLEEHFDITDWTEPPPPGSDWSHANGIEATEDGAIVLSLRALDTVLAIDGRPESPTFLDILWRISGSDRGLPGADHVTAPGEGFAQQHNASVVDGHLYLFDNSSDPSVSAASRYVFDGEGPLVRDQRWEMDRQCAFQGGAEPVGDGGVVATCAPSWRISQFAPDRPEPVYTLFPVCTDPSVPLLNQNLNRAIPIWF